MKQNSKLKGFSLVELLVAMFISTLIIITVVAAFASVFRTQKKAREMQTNIETAKGAMEYMAKIIRMSNNVSGNATAVYMHNQSLDQCMQIEYHDPGSGGDRLIRSRTCKPASADNPCGTGNFSTGAGNDCEAAPSSYIQIANVGQGSVSFLVSSDIIKKVTILMQLANDPNAKFQTTVSTRDYGKLNPIMDK